METNLKIDASGAALDAGWGDLLSGANGARSIALAGGVALHAINVYIATTILPSVVADIGGLEYYAWNTTIFVVASILGASLSTGVLARVSPRNAYALASIIFALGAIVCAIAPAMPVLLIGRTVQGAGGGMLVSFSYAMIRRVFAEPLWSRAMAMVSGMWGVATLLGPLIGGVFAQMNAWRWAFWALVPLILAFLLLSQRVMPSARDRSSHAEGAARGTANEANSARVPVLQLALLVSAIVTVSAGSLASDAVWNVFSVGMALVLLTLLVLVENRVSGEAGGLLPRGAFRLTSLSAVYATMTLLVVGTTTEIFVPLMLQVLHHLSPLVAGYMTALGAMGWSVAALLSSGAQWRRARRAIVVGPLVMLGGLVGLAFLLPGGRGPISITAIALCLVALGFGVGMGWPHLLTLSLTVVPESERDLASASITTIQLLATAFGAAIAGMVANFTGLTNPGGVAGTANAALWLFACFAFSALGAGCCAVWLSSLSSSATE